ncbi:MAG: hypothetical protein PHV66_07690 [Bacteroidales bacterium]|jgi:hypothetical protein|nr:hypothetical protein [Bacteroidales bacterium]
MHEAAVLLQALIDILTGNIKREQAVSDVSKRLRQIALSHGNKNGENLQMNCLEYAFTDGKTGLHVTSG